MDVRSYSSALSLGDDGIWYSDGAEQAVSFPVDGNEKFFSVEEKSFWFTHRNQCIASVVKAFQPPGNGPIFDIGGGNGFVSAGLFEEGFEVAVVEPGRTGASNAKRRGLEHVICATTDAAAFKPQSLPAVGLFDVLEHVPDDAAYLRALNRLLIAEGRLYLTVPAYAFLWSEKDVLLGHFRRYALGDITHLLRSTGFHIDFASYFFRFLPLPIFALRTVPYKLGLSRKETNAKNVYGDHATKGGLGDRMVKTLLRPEVGLLAAKRPMSFGGSCLVVARRSASAEESPY